MEYADDLFDFDQMVDELDDTQDLGVEYDDIDPIDDLYDVEEESANAASEWERERDKRY